MDKNLILKRVTSFSIILMIFDIVLNICIKVPKPIDNAIVIFAMALMYGTGIVKYRLENGRFHIGLSIMAIICVVWYGIRLFYETPFNNIGGLAFMYCYFIMNGKIQTGKINKVLLSIGIASVSITALNTFYDNKIVTSLVAVVQVCILLRILNPFFYKIGMAGREKRLEREAVEGKKEVSFIRRLLFGKSGTFNTEIIKSMTTDMKKK